MDGNIKNLLAYCSKIDFGPVILKNGGKDFCTDLNNEIFSLLKTLPESTQSGALFFVMRYFRIPFGEKFSIFMKYYVPAWSIIYWLIQFIYEKKKLNQNDINRAITAHSMALLLHPLDDHINDGQIQASHLALLLRSQSWMIMNNALDRLADKIDGGHKIVKIFLNNYYSSICNFEEANSLDDYSDRFRKQMATWMIVPVLLTTSINTEPKALKSIQSAYESFGIAWRLLDDINDIQTDMMQGSRSAIYSCLPEDIKIYWDNRTEDKKYGGTEFILDYILENDVIEIIKERIWNELNSAASTADACNMAGWADELRCLSYPLRK